MACNKLLCDKVLPCFLSALCFHLLSACTRAQLLPLRVNPGILLHCLAVPFPVSTSAVGNMGTSKRGFSSLHLPIYKTQCCEKQFSRITWEPKQEKATSRKTAKLPCPCPRSLTHLCKPFLSRHRLPGFLLFFPCALHSQNDLNLLPLSLLSSHFTPPDCVPR